MNVAFVYDGGNADGTKGGAELAMEEFAATCPASVAITDVDEAEVVVVGNCVTIHPEIIDRFDGKRVVRFHHDLARYEHPVLLEWLDENAEHVFTSPLHKERYKVAWTTANKMRDWPIIPPCPELSRFKPNRETRRHGKRQGTVTVGTWQNPGKGGTLIAETLEAEGQVADCFGTGVYAPQGPHIRFMGEVEPGALPQIRWQYERFMFLPTAVEPFGRCVAEAWRAGCEIVTNGYVGAKWWIENQPDKLDSCAEDFWGLICEG